MKASEWLFLLQLLDGSSVWSKSVLTLFIVGWDDIIALVNPASIDQSNNVPVGLDVFALEHIFCYCTFYTAFTH